MENPVSKPAVPVFEFQVGVAGSCFFSTISERTDSRPKTFRWEKKKKKKKSMMSLSQVWKFVVPIKLSRKRMNKK